MEILDCMSNEVALLSLCKILNIENELLEEIVKKFSNSILNITLYPDIEFELSKLCIQVPLYFYVSFYHFSRTLDLASYKNGLFV